jgi:mRNA-degrading endonuclease YafQ of YafQ-DinJ toxin-antitoxin module
MRRALVRTPPFERAYRRFVRRRPQLRRQIEAALRQMEADVFAPRLGTHKLSGDLLGLRACACGYDCRIVFSIETDSRTATEVIVLHSVGTHEQVY